MPTRLLREMGYTVETGVSGIPTAIMATYGSGRPVIAVHVEKATPLRAAVQSTSSNDSGDITWTMPHYFKGEIHFK